MSVYQGLSLLFGSGVLVAVLRFFYGKAKERAKKTEAVELGTQAILRSLMISDFNKWTDRGYAPIYARENFENMYQKYHGLGANGVMDDIRKEFLALPYKPENE